MRGLLEPAGLGVGRRQRIEEVRVAISPTEQGAKEIDGLRPVAEPLDPDGSENPGEVVRRAEVARLDAQDLAVILQGLGGLAL